MADSGKLSFVELMKQQPSYGPLLDKPVKYQLTALYNGTYWSLAIKRDQTDLPYVTIEVILSDDGKTIVRAVRIVDYKEDELSLLKPTKIGIYGPDKTLTKLCQVAENTFKEVYNDKRQEFTPRLVENLGFQAELPTTTTTYYTIEVAFGSGYQKCYLGTQNNDMRFPTDFPDGNISVNWNCDPSAFQSSAINAVTEQSPIPTYMELGPSISRSPITYQVILRGPAQTFNFTNSEDLFDIYAISAMDGDDNMTYLKPQESGAIVAVAQTDVPFVFRLTPLLEVRTFVLPTTPQNSL